MRLTTLTTGSSIFVGSKGRIASGGKGHPVNEGWVKRGLSAKGRRFSSNLSIHGIIRSALFSNSSTLLHNERAIDPNVTVYSDEASMVDGNNGESTLPVVTPEVVEKQRWARPQAQLVVGLSGD